MIKNSSKRQFFQWLRSGVMVAACWRPNILSAQDESDGHATKDTWFVRPEKDPTTGDGRSYDNAWQGFSSIVWGPHGVKAGDTLYVCGLHDDSFRGTTMRIGASGFTKIPITIRGDYPGDPCKISRPDDQHIISTNSHNYLNIKNIHLMESASGGISVSGSHDVCVDNVEIQQVQVGISIKGQSEHINIRNCHIHDVGNGIYSYRYEGVNNRLTIIDNVIEDVGQNPAWSRKDRHGIGLQDGDHHLIDGNTIRRSSGSGITAWKADGGTMQNMVISNNTIDEIHDTGDYDDGSFRGIEISGQNSPGIEDWAALAIEGNYISNCGREGIYLKGRTPITGPPQNVINNIINRCYISFGFSEFACADGDDVGFLLTGNTFTEPTNHHFDHQHNSRISLKYSGLDISGNVWRPQYGLRYYEWKGQSFDTYDLWISEVKRS